jgi:LacI family transcriptional regulator
MTKTIPHEHTGEPDVPTAERVAQALRERIGAGRYPPASWLPSERAIAAEVGAGRPSVREALATLQQEGLIERAPGGRPRVASVRSSVRNGARTVSRVIATILPQPPSYVTAHAILGGVSRALVSASPRYSMLVYDPAVLTDAGTSAAEPELEAIHRAEHEGAAGIVIWSCLEPSCVQELARLEASGVPVVYMDRAPTDRDCDFVGVDNRGGVMLAVRYLHDLGHRRIAFLSHPDRIGTVLDREQGYLDGLNQLGHRTAARLIYRGGRTIGPRAEEALDQFLTHPQPPTAAIAVNDLHAFELLRAAGQRGMRIPQDLSVIGFDDVDQYSPGPGTLTAVRQPFSEIGLRAAELLLRRIRDRQRNGQSRMHVILGTTLTIRSTTGPCPRRRRAPDSARRAGERGQP